MKDLIVDRRRERNRLGDRSRRPLIESDFIFGSVVDSDGYSTERYTTNVKHTLRMQKDSRSGDRCLLTEDSRVEKFTRVGSRLEPSALVIIRTKPNAGKSEENTKGNDDNLHSRLIAEAPRAALVIILGVSFNFSLFSLAKKRCNFSKHRKAIL